MTNQSTDRLKVTCDHCQREISITRAMLGKKGRCPHCQQVFLLAEKRPPETEDDELWSDLRLSPLEDTPSASSLPSQPTNDPRQAMASVYLAMARKDESIIQEQERQPVYRFMTSWGAVIGSILLLVLGVAVFLSLSIRLGLFMIVPAIGGLIQGINYIFYYRYLDSQGR